MIYHGIGNLCNYTFYSMAEIVVTSTNVFEEINNATIASCGSFAVAHCVSEDFQMSRGIAVQFK